jgi:FtsP/CotA-like multicopper oxidase with cupredoxin domain
MQIQSIDDGTNATEAWSGSHIVGGQLKCDIEYGYACEGDWLDTLQLPTALDNGRSGAVLRFQTDTFIGNDVLHCHYLNHEDLGCISFMRIV